MRRAPAPRHAAEATHAARRRRSAHERCTEATGRCARAGAHAAPERTAAHLQAAAAARGDGFHPARAPPCCMPHKARTRTDRPGLHPGRTGLLLTCSGLSLDSAPTSGAAASRSTCSSPRTARSLSSSSGRSSSCCRARRGTSRLLALSCSGLSCSGGRRRASTQLPERLEPPRSRPPRTAHTTISLGTVCRPGTATAGAAAVDADSDADAATSRAKATAS